MDFYEKTPQGVWIEGNAYAGHAKPFRMEDGSVEADGITASLEQEGNKWILTLNVPQSVADAGCVPVTTQRLGMPRITEQPYEAPDGSPIDFTVDLLGRRRGDRVIPGPFADLRPGVQKITVWEA